MAKVLSIYLEVEKAKLFTVICLPQNHGTFPTVIARSPYVDADETLSEEKICENKLNDYKHWVDSGYAVVFQHCRGRGKSTGDCIPYINEREDGLFCKTGSGNSLFTMVNYIFPGSVTHLRCIW